MAQEKCYIWLVVKRVCKRNSIFLLGGKTTRWSIAHSAGIHFTKHSAAECAARFHEDSVDYEYSTRRYTRG
jgi:hypothetical protein